LFIQKLFVTLQPVFVHFYEKMGYKTTVLREDMALFLKLKIKK